VPLDEKALRRPEFQEGVPVTLSDGQAWHFPRPVLAGFGFTRGADGRTRLVRSFDAPDGFDRLVDAFVNAEGPSEEAVALADLAYDLLSRNYSLSFADCRPLLRLAAAGDPGAAGSDAMWSEIADVAMGRGPKPTPAGSAPA
jgi:hypothetical protein